MDIACGGGEHACMNLNRNCGPSYAKVKYSKRNEYLVLSRVGWDQTRKIDFISKQQRERQHIMPHMSKKGQNYG